MYFKKFELSDLSYLWRTLTKEDAEVSEIDLTEFTFISPFMLVGMCALIDYLLLISKQVYIILPKNNIEIKGYFISFITNIGFFDLWKTEFDLKKIIFRNFPVNALYKYKGNVYQKKFDPNNTYRRWTKIHRIEGDARKREKILTDIVLDLEQRLPSEQKKTPLFSDDEFEEVFLIQLAENIANHTTNSGYFMARSYSNKDIKKSRNTDMILPNCSNELKNICFEKGFFEISISDCGSGICDTLFEAYILVREEILNHDSKYIYDNFDIKDVVQFALDEFGSRLLLSDDGLEQLVEKHSLNQVFQYTRKYGGSMRIITSGVCLDFDTTGIISRGNFDLGFQGNLVNRNCCAKGLNIRVILPHEQNKIQSYPGGVDLFWPKDYPVEKKLPYFYYIGNEISSKPDIGEIKRKCSKLTEFVLNRKLNEIALDFSGTSNWEPSLFVSFLKNIQNLLTSRRCWGINVPNILISGLMSRWTLGSSLPEYVSYSRLLAFPCLDAESMKPLLVSMDTSSISVGLIALLYPEFSENGEMEPKKMLTSNLIAHIFERTKIKIDHNILENVLRKHPHLFETNDIISPIKTSHENQNEHYWISKIDYPTMYRSAQHVMMKNFENVLVETNAIFTSKNSNERKKLFELPTSGMLVDKYIWTYNLLQEGKYTEEIARRLKKIINDYLEKINKNKEIGGIITVTAPSRILAEELSKYYSNRPTVLDLGTVNELDPDDVLRSFERNKVKNCIIVTDVINTKQQLQRLIYTIEYAGIEVVIIASIIRFIEEPNNNWVGCVIDEDFKSTNLHRSEKLERENYPVAYLYEYQKPNRYDTDIVENGDNDYQVFWIEPYSLRPFSIESLQEPYFAWENEERLKNYPRRISILDKNICILYGHFKDRNHHNRVLIHMQRLLDETSIIHEICLDIIDFIKKQLPSVVIIPLHSNIHFIIPYLKTYLRNEKKILPFICTIAVDLKGRGPFYVLPEGAQEILKKVKDKNVLFLDDGILTGRTIDTFIRAVLRFSHGEKVDLGAILIYCIINRTGRASTTKWRSISHIDSKTIFLFREFIRFETPVFTNKDCPVCEDQKRLKYYLDHPKINKQSLVSWIKKEIDLLSPTVINTQEYRNSTSEIMKSENPIKDNIIDFAFIDNPEGLERNVILNKDLPDHYKEIRVSTINGLLWWFWERGYRGCPPILLLKEIEKWLDSSYAPSGIQKEKILSEIILWALENISSIRTKSIIVGGSDSIHPLPKILIRLTKELIAIGNISIPRILEKAAYILTSRQDDNLSIENFYELARICFDTLKYISKGDTVLAIIHGLQLMILNAKRCGILNNLIEYSFLNIDEYSKENFKWSGYVKYLNIFLEDEMHENDFIYALRALCYERYKYRHSLIYNMKKIEIYRYGDLDDRLGYLKDYLPIIVRWIDTVFGNAKEENDPRLFKDIKIVKLQVKNVLKLLDNKYILKNQKKSKLLEHLEQISMRLVTKTRIGECLDYYNPSISDVVKSIINEIKHKNVKGKTSVEFVKQELDIVWADKAYLRDTIKNHSWDVLNQHGNYDSKILIETRLSNDNILLLIHNNWIKASDANRLVNTGLSLHNERKMLEIYGITISPPIRSDNKEFRSMIKIKFEQGLRKNKT